MGRQITVDLVPLLKAGCTLRVENYGEVDAYLRVELPNASVICSDDSSLGSLSFDCRDISTSPTGWMEEWLIVHGVPYAAA